MWTSRTASGRTIANGCDEGVSKLLLDDSPEAHGHGKSYVRKAFGKYLECGIFAHALPRISVPLRSYLVAAVSGPKRPWASKSSAKQALSPPRNHSGWGKGQKRLLLPWWTHSTLSTV